MIKHTKEELAKIAKESSYMGDMLTKLGKKSKSGDLYSHYYKKIKEYNIDISHWKTPSHHAVARKHINQTPDEVLVNNKYVKSKTLRNNLLKIGVKYCCNICGLDSWQNKQIVLEIDHINGNNKDNTRENLRFLCPNCHSQTDTFGNKKRI